MRSTLPFLRVLFLSTVITIPVYAAASYKAPSAEQRMTDVRSIKLTLSAKNKSVEEVLNAIEKKTAINIHYDKLELSRGKLVTLNVKETPLDMVFRDISNQTGLQFAFFNDKVIVSSNTRSVAKDIKGTVKDNTGAGLVGVSVSIKGTRKGVQTNNNGQYSISAEQGDVLVFTYIGYSRKEVTVGASNEINVILLEDSKQLGEVVVTALGIKKERKALGYSVTEVKGAELTQARENNMINSLAGKVAGLSVGGNATGMGGSSNITIRGVSSISQTNQPLYVVNGVPMESAASGNLGSLVNKNGNTASRYDNAPDLGDAISNLNPDDIESMSVLKGAAASALYGSRAKAGVILITTKSGKGNSIEYNTNYVAEKVINTTDWQYVYGQGANNIKPTDQTAAGIVGGSSWGAKLDGSNVVQFDGVSRPYSAQKDNMKNFYRTGGTWTNTLALNKSFDGGTIRFSASALANNAINPNSGLDRQTFNFTGIFNPLKRLTIDARANYILEQAKNRSFLSDGAGNANYNVMFLPTSLDIRNLKPGTKPDGSELSYNTGNPFATNPWFAANNIVNNTNRERLIGSVSARYNFDNGLFLQGRAGRDSYTDKYNHILPSGTAYYTRGKIVDQTTRFADLNLDVLIGKPFKVNDDFTVTPNIGASYRKTDVNQTTNNGDDFAVIGVYNILNAKNKSVTYDVSKSETQSVYGTLELAYKNYLYLTGSSRTDWFSTLATPGKNNKLYVTYPSISGSFVFSELLDKDWLSFGKLRTGYAIVGQATIPYQTQLSYNFRSENINGFPLGTVSNPNIPNTSLIASEASEFEIGTELRFFGNRLNVDLTWYNKKSKNEIVVAPTSITSGYPGAVLNSGTMRNQGFEALISGTILNFSNFKWVSSVNGSVNNNKILSLADGTESLLLGTSRSNVGFVSNVIGLPAGQIQAYDYLYDNNGKIVYSNTGIPERGALKEYGSAYHKWAAGWNNEFSYKGINLSFLIDGKWGGKIFSGTDYFGYQFGLHKATLENREGTWGSGANTVDAATYYSTFADHVSKQFVQDASFIKLRQLTLGYTFPTKLFNNKIQGLNISLVARNLFTLMKRTDNIDPESSYNASVPGLELGGVPPIRTFGFNLNVKF